MTEVDFEMYDKRSLEYPAPFKVTIAALPSMMKFLFTVYQNRKGEETVPEFQMHLYNYEYTAAEGLEGTTDIADPFDNT